MEKEFLEKIKEKLKKEAEKIENQLNVFAKEKPGKDWETIFPKSNGSSGSALEETQADAIEEYLTLLSLEEILETKLKQINRALEKIEKGTFGICERCKKEIEKERLEILPEAKFCQDCQK